jgi:hypothetical protein
MLAPDAATPHEIGGRTRFVVSLVAKAHPRIRRAGEACANGAADGPPLASLRLAALNLRQVQDANRQRSRKLPHDIQQVALCKLRMPNR